MPSSNSNNRRTIIRKRKHSKEFVIWCDESDIKGKYCSNFYGGVLVKSDDLKEVQNRLKAMCNKHRFFHEIKWQRVTEHYLDKYMAIMDEFFTLVSEGKVKVRIMYTQNAYIPKNLTEIQKKEGYFILYYHFIQHAFGLPHSNGGTDDIHLRLYFDYLPDTLARRQAFKEFIKGLQNKRPFQLAKLKIRKQDITEVDSKKHLLLQMLDVVLGSMCFRLNNKHREIPEGKKRRGKRTVAKEKLYKHINKKLRELRPGFNVGATTGRDTVEDSWNHPYRHWIFRSKEYEIDTTLFK
jgi:hypothetical protein